MKYLLTGGLILARILLYAQDTCVAKKDYWRLAEIARVTPIVLQEQDTIISLMKEELNLRREANEELRKVGNEQRELYLSAERDLVAEKRRRPLWLIGGLVLGILIAK